MKEESTVMEGNDENAKDKYTMNKPLSTVYCSPARNAAPACSATRSVAGRRNAAGGLFTSLTLFLLAALAPRAEAVGINATGGTITNYTANGTNYTAHIFKSNGSFTVTNMPAGITFEILVVAGGGGGGGDVGGGGGAGGLIYSNNIALTLNQAYTNVVGGGGTGPGGSGNRGNNGNPSYFSNTVSGAKIRAEGGGGGGAYNTGVLNGLDGGSGGGGGGRESGGPATPGQGTAGQGYGGGTGLCANAGGAFIFGRGGGGGGAGHVGYSGATTDTANGGDGLQFALEAGTNQWYAGGGGGSTDGSGSSGAGGQGGGGAGGGGNGTANTGGGGGGQGAAAAGNGGSGIIVVRYCIIIPPPTITVSDTSHGFPDTFVNATGSWSYTVSGVSLSNNVTISAPSPDFTIATNAGGPYGSQVVVPTNADGTVSITTIYVHFVPTLIQAYAGTLTNSSLGAADKLVTLTGNGLAASTPILSVTPSSLDFGNVITNKTSANLSYTVTGANLTNNVTVTPPSASFAVSTNGSAFYPSLILATNALGGLDITNVYVRFTPSAGPGSYAGSITNACAGVTPQLVAVTGTGVVQTLSVSAGTLDCGAVVVGASLTNSFTVSGTNLEDNVTVTAPSAEFTVSTNATGGFGSSCTVLVAGASAPSGATLASTLVYVKFTPPAVGSYSNNLTCGSAGAVSQTKAVIGTGFLPALYISAGTLAFGDAITNKTTFSQSYTVSGSNLTTNVTVTAPAGFKVSTSSGSGFGSSLTLTQTGGTVPLTTVYVRFSPTAVQDYSGSITNSSAGAANGLQAVTGNGVASIAALVSSVGDIVFVTNLNGKAYGVHVFTTTNVTYSFVPSKDVLVEYLIVGGGGGTRCGNQNGAGAGGGGGGGQVATGTTSAAADQTYTINVGAGGTNNFTLGYPGDQSSALGIIAVGGDGCSAANGASCGGGAYAGGTSYASSGTGGGGGGAGGVGQNGTSSKAGDGGSGVVSSISGIATYYGGGGGGGADWDTGNIVYGLGGLGGGGHGGQGHNGNLPPADGDPNTGGGGGGAGYPGSQHAKGGSGIVILRYAIPAPKGLVIMLK